MYNHSTTIRRASSDRAVEKKLEGEPGNDMKEYFIIRKGKEEVTGDKLGEQLTLTYYDEDGQPLKEVPSKVGTYKVKAEFAGNDKFEQCSVEGTYSIKLPDWITCDGVQSKVYDGTPVEATNIQVDSGKYSGEYTTDVSYEGTLLNNAKYDSEQGMPFKPGKYKVTIKAKDSSGNVFCEKIIDIK